MGNKFIMKFAVTVCLLAVLSIEGLFLYCHYIEDISMIQYASEKLHTLQDWFSHNSTQTANAQPPSREESLTASSAASRPLLFQTAGHAIQEMFADSDLVIPEVSPAAVPSSISSDTGTKADPADQGEGTKKPASTDINEEKEKKGTMPDTGADPVTVHDLMERQEADGLLRNGDSRIQLEAESILQYPELPTGCEVTSLTMALRFAGYDVSKEELADRYLDKASPGTVSYKAAFWGDPRQAESFGCYAPVIVNAANKYLTEQKSPKRAYDLTGTSLDDILAEIRMGCPAIVWGSMYINEEIIFSYGWDIDGETVMWPSNEHCMLLIGFDTEKNSVIVCDPLEGIVSYDKNAFQHHYETLEQQAIVIY